MLITSIRTTKTINFVIFGRLSWSGSGYYGHVIRDAVNEQKNRFSSALVVAYSRTSWGKSAVWTVVLSNDGCYYDRRYYTEIIYHAIIHAILHNVVRPTPCGRGEDVLKLCMRVESKGQR